MEKRIGCLSLVIAQSAGVKINGRRPTINDFLPEYAQEEPEWMVEARKAIEKQQTENR